MSPIVVRGSASAEQVAAVLAALATASAAPVEAPYERWRRGRVAAARATDITGPSASPRPPKAMR